MPPQAEAIDARDAHSRLQLDPEAMLVCAYEGKKFGQHRLEDAIPLDQFRRREETLGKDREIFFYCA